MALSSELQTTLTRASHFIRDAEALVITSGAGMGVDSGLPDFRGQEGFWKAYPPMQQLGLSFYQIARPEWFRRDPCLAWGFYGHRAELYRKTVPNPGFTKLLALSKQMKFGHFVVTSNVDGHFQKSGFHPERVVEVHGSILHLQCVNRCGQKIVELPESHHFDIDESTFKLRTKENIPPCPLKCGNLCRPNVLLFGDWEWISTRTDEQTHRFNTWVNTLPKKVRLCIIEIGAGKAVPTIRYESEELFNKFENSGLIRINPRDSDFPGDCAEAENAFSLPVAGLKGLELLGL